MAGSDLDQLTGGRLNAELAKAVVRVHNQYVGRGPSRAHSFFRNNVAVVILAECLTRAERTLVEGGEAEMVLAMRRQLRAAMERELIGETERLTGCRVVAFMSDSHIDPDMAAEVFVLDRPVPGEPDFAGAAPDAPVDP